MPAAMGMVIKGVAASIIELVKKPQCDGTNNPYSQCREEVFSIDGVRNEWPQEVSHCIHQNDNDRGYYKIAQVQIPICFRVIGPPESLFLPKPNTQLHSRSCHSHIWHGRQIKNAWQEGFTNIVVMANNFITILPGMLLKRCQ